MSARLISSVLIVVTLIVWILWDIYAALFGGPGATESEVIRDWASYHPSIAVGLGTVAGHWFINRPPIKDDDWRMASMIVCWSTLATFMLFDFVTQLFTAYPIYPLLTFAVGMGMGALLWPMAPAKRLT